MSALKTVAVVGATGLQGSSVVRALAATNNYHIKALTRNPDSAAAQALLAQPNTTLHQANIDDAATLAAAFADSHAIFAVTNFWEHLFAGLTPASAGDREFQQALAIARAAAAVPTLQHFIWSTQPDASALTEGKFPVPHCDFKAKADAAIKAELPELAAKTTFMVVDFYPNNIAVMPPVMPHEVPGSYGCHVVLLPCGADTRVPNTGSLVSVGVWVRQVLAHPVTRGKYVGVRVGWMTWREMMEVWGRVKGKRTMAVRVAREDFEGMWGFVGVELACQFSWQEDMTAKGTDYVDDYRRRGVWVDAREIGIEPDTLVGLEGALGELKAAGVFV